MEESRDDVGESGQSSKPLDEEAPDPDEDDLDDLDGKRCLPDQEYIPVLQC